MFVAFMYRYNVTCQIIVITFTSFTHRGENILVKRVQIKTNLHVKMFIEFYIKIEYNSGADLASFKRGGPHFINLH